MKHLRMLTCGTKPLLGHRRQRAESRRASRSVSSSTSAAYAGRDISSNQETTTKSKTPDMACMNQVLVGKASLQKRGRTDAHVTDVAQILPPSAIPFKKRPRSLQAFNQALQISHLRKKKKAEFIPNVCLPLTVPRQRCWLLRAQLITSLPEELRGISVSHLQGTGGTQGRASAAETLQETRWVLFGMGRVEYRVQITQPFLV